LENGRGENDEVSRRVWEAVETNTGEVGVGEAKEEEAREEAGKKREEKGKTIEVKKVVEEWEIWEEEEEAAKSEAEAKKLVPEKFHEWIKVFGKKQSERMPTRKAWDHVIDVREGFVPKKGKVYPLSRGGGKRVC